MLQLLVTFAAALSAQPDPSFVANPCPKAMVRREVVCGTVTVPEDRRRPDGRQIALNVVVIHAKNPSPGTAPLFDFSGGPGLADTDGAGFFLFDGAAYSAKRDVVMVDQRGTGGSNPLDCPELEAAEHSLQPMFPVDGVRACRERLSKHANLRKYTTDDWISDVDDVRRALGYDKINLMGLSYGTTAALRYIARYGEHVRAAVLQSTAPAFAMPPKEHAVVAQSALRRLFADCAADRSCNAHYPHLEGDLRQAIEQLKREGKVEPEVALERLRTLLYAPAGMRRAPAVIESLAAGDVSPIRPQEQGLKYYLGVYLTITCAESLPWFDYKKAAARAQRTAFGDYRLRRQRTACANWPRARVSRSMFTPVRSNAPALFISGARDAVTPPVWATRVLKGFRNGRQVVVPWSSHVYDGLSNLDTCLDAKMILPFLDSADVRSVDASCAAQMLPPPFDVGAKNRP